MQYLLKSKRNNYYLITMHCMKPGEHKMTITTQNNQNLPERIIETMLGNKFKTNHDTGLKVRSSALCG